MQEHKLCTFPLFLVRLAWAKQGRGGGWHNQNMQKCKSALLRFRLVWLAWVKRIAWLAQKEYAKVQRCSFCIFALSAVMAGIVKLMKCKWYLQKHTFCTWLVRLAWAKDGAKSPTDH